MEGMAMHESGCEPNEEFAFVDAFADQTPLKLFEVAKTSMNQFARATGGSGSESCLFDQYGGVSCGRSGLSHSHSVNSTADHKDITVVGAGRFGEVHQKLGRLAIVLHDEISYDRTTRCV
jgi:hypothetical protein